MALFNAPDIGGISSSLSSMVMGLKNLIWLFRIVRVSELFAVAGDNLVQGVFEC